MTTEVINVFLIGGSVLLPAKVGTCVLHHDKGCKSTMNANPRALQYNLFS